MSTGATTTVPVVIATLVANFQAAAGLAGVQVLYGDTAQAERENLILTGDVQWSDEVWAAALGNRSREEQYTVDGYLQVRRPGDNQQAALERACTLLAAVESTLRAMAANGGMSFSAALNAAFGVGKAQVANCEFKPTKGLGFPFQNEGMAYQVDFGIRITARI